MPLYWLLWWKMILSFNDLRNLLIKDQDKLKLIRMTVQKGSPSINKKIKNIKLPTEAVLVAILRGDNSLVPRGIRGLQKTMSFWL